MRRKNFLFYLTFFLIIGSNGCRDTSKKNLQLPGTEFIDALLVRDTLLLNRYLDSLSLKLVGYYSIPVIKDPKDVHYRLIISRVSRVPSGVQAFRLTVIFPWKERFSIVLVPEEKKWSFLISKYLKGVFSKISKDGVTYFHPPTFSEDSAKTYLNRLLRFKREICAYCNKCCSEKLVYVYTPDVDPHILYNGFLGESHSVVLNGTCISVKPFDTVNVMHALLDRNKYLYPFVRGVYHYYYGDHQRFGIDYGDWAKSEFSTGSFRLIGNLIIDNIIFYKPISGALGYIFIDYLVSKKHMKKKEIFSSLFSMNSEERKIVENNGDMQLFFRKHVNSHFRMSSDSLLMDVGLFIFKKYRDIKKQRDTIRFIRDKKRNVTFVISSKYKNGREIAQQVSSWIDSIGFFHKPYYTFLLVPLWLVDSMREALSNTNFYWVPGYEFKTNKEILKELKKAYATFLVSDFIRTYSIQEKQFPMWFSLGVPMYLSCGQNCAIDISSILVLPKGSVEAFYANPVKAMLPARAILLSYMMVRLTDNLHKGSVTRLMEKSIANLDFTKTYKEVTRRDIHELFDKWKLFVRDTLYLRVSRK